MSDGVDRDSADGGSTVAATDSKYIWVIHWQSPSIYGACTTCCGTPICAVVDGNTSTGNCWNNGPFVFDMGESKTVRSIRVWANGSRRWTLLVGDNLASCGTDWPSPKWNWSPENGQWSETPVTPMTGRYIRFYVDLGGPVGANTLMEFQYQAW